MTLILKQIFSLLKVLNSDTGENQIAAGIACGLILGFAPVLSLQTLLVFIVIFFFRVQVAAAFASAFFFALVAWIFDPFFDYFGGMILEIESLRGVFTLLYGMPIVPFTKFYNSIVMGAGVISILMAPFIFILSKKTVVKYRQTILERLKNSKFWKAIKATGLYKWYAKYDELYG
ncbi:MAG: TIGR03546 family protein [Halobacteriovoraceae bacterium]|nr:TIGR03546 family protein [Halobacteriovoraceae bacterium]|tara:strand:+ start:20 stop:544 length:525 start_codon:yes stop_codon:yes gene_type:complete